MVSVTKKDKSLENVVDGGRRKQKRIQWARLAIRLSCVTKCWCVSYAIRRFHIKVSTRYWREQACIRLPT